MNKLKKSTCEFAGIKKKMLTKHIFLIFTVVQLISFSGINRVSAQSVKNNSYNLKKTNTLWHGFDRYDFIMDEKTYAIIPSNSIEGEGDGVNDPVKGQWRCVLIVPKNPAQGNPWSWRGCYWNHQPQAEIELLKRGFYVAYISAGQDLKPGKHWDVWYDYLVTKLGLSLKPAFIGMSRGGEYSYSWAVAHPDKVSCIYADNTGGNIGIMKGIVDLALNDVPILQVCGSIDPILGKFSLPIESIYHQFGGRISMMIKEGFGHHPHSLKNPTIIADFIEQSVQEIKPVLPDFATEKSNRKSYYSVEGIFRNFPEEGAFITCLGPQFTECYNRYEIEIPGVEAFTTVIAPRIAAPGKPWVFRSDFVNRDATVDQALLAKGYYIVTGAVPFNGEGPIIAQWNIIYKYLTDHGFSNKAVMEGSGSSTGEVYAWAIENPDKVSCIYGVNPILKSNLAKIQPIDNLQPLAKKGISILHVCGSLDPNYITQTKEVQKRYLKLGGKMTICINEGQGHQLSITNDLKKIVDFIINRTR